MNHTLAGQPSPSSRWRTLIDTVKQLDWKVLTAGIALGMLGVHVFVTRPLTVQIGSVRSDMAALRAALDEVAGSRDDVWKTNDLLTALQHQHDRIVTARQAVERFGQLQDQIHAYSSDTSVAAASLDQLARLQTRIAALESRQPGADNALNQIDSLYDRVALVAAATPASVQGLGEAQDGLQQLEQLKQQVLDNSAQIDAARTSLDGLVTLKSGLIAGGGDVEAAQGVAVALLSLKNDVATGADQLEAAERHTSELLALHDSLSDEQHLQLGKAEQTLDGLLRLQADLAGQTDQIADSVQTLELLGDFQKEFATEISRLNGMRHDLADLILLQNSVAQIVKTLRPLAELSDLRRLGDHEVREAARVILDCRTARVGTHDRSVVGVPATAAASEPTPIDRLVPTPPAGETDE